MGASQDPVLLQKTADFVATKARDSDITMFFRSLIGNFQARRFATKYLFDNYDTVSDPFYDYIISELKQDVPNKLYIRLKDNLSLPDFIRVSFKTDIQSIPAHLGIVMRRFLFKSGGSHDHWDLLQGKNYVESIFQNAFNDNDDASRIRIHLNIIYHWLKLWIAFKHEADIQR
jgi:hypothetical protein